VPLRGPNPPSLRAIVGIALPAAAAVGVFGTLYGATARAILGAPLAVASSLLVYSGAMQFAMVAPGCCVCILGWPA
jgi:predicted branched-subunit amino acid permease